MRVETIKRKLYIFDELEDDAKEKAREWYRGGNLDYEWHDCIYEDTKTIAELFGLDITKIYFSGFSSQGDGACFEGHYEYKKGSLKAVKDYAPQDSDLYEIVQNLQQLQSKHFYQLQADTKHKGHYYHSMCTDITIYDYNINGGWCREDTEESLSELLWDYMNWIYKRLDREYWWLQSDENVDENIICNEYEFLKDGTRA